MRDTVEGVVAVATGRGSGAIPRDGVQRRRRVRQDGRTIRWGLAPDGTIWSASSGQHRLVQTGPCGDTLRIVETSHRPAEFDEDDRAVITERLAEAGISKGTSSWCGRWSTQFMSWTTATSS